jgi:hypothetical protein
LDQKKNLLPVRAPESENVRAVWYGFLYPEVGFGKSVNPME